MALNEHHSTAFVVAVFFFWMTHNPIGAVIAAIGGYYGAKHFGDKLGGKKDTEEESKEEEEL